MGPRSRQRRAGAVQSTNDSSALSKSSLAASGYVHDTFAALLVPGTARRAPLIHRGYYVRARAVRHCVRAFLGRACAAPGAPRAQILSLGAGSDSLYFRLKAAGRLSGAAVWEVDFPDVARRKAERIRETPELCALTGPFQSGDPASSLCLESSDYHILGLDLRQLERLDRALTAAGLGEAAPTLLLAEAVLTYLEPDNAAALITWAAQRFPNALFVIYEQMRPHDTFGLFMQQHFQQLNSPLHGLDRFPDVESQQHRFLQAGWAACRAMDMNEFYRCFLPAEERRRVENLEPFDEFEEWHLKCAHYFILAASKGDTLSQILVHSSPELFPRVDPASPSGILLASVATSDSQSPSFKRYGHASVLLSPGILSAGGFGEQEGRHCRMSKFHFLSRYCDLEWKGKQIGSWGTEAQWDGRLYHTMTRLSDTQVLVLGGRLSPVTPALGILQLSFCKSEDDSTEDVSVMVTKASTEEDSTLSCWRHSTTEVSYENQKYLFVYGGRSVAEPVLSDWHFFHVESMTWVKVPVEGDTPEGRHSHSACSWQGGVLIAGGLGASEEPLSSVVFLEPITCGFLWKSVDVQPPITPRYSHTAHVLNEKLLLVGGVWIHSSSVPGVTVIDLTTGLSSEYQIDTTCVSWPLMLHNHTSILLPEEQQLLLLGGGGNCFSFGTYFNPHIVTLDLSSLSAGQ
ncbi:tRNA wybutosine-synthesizing protein 4 [Pipistrellus kuhlii]|uniref:tRNA wybutosine-synthesizing protein 4 n=1 Tax=Pipistrellus kuhlii TaxID=59472 RepID=A0A7J8B135_PIPKU|nr:tRNA wybutosine-synthesizing protein 4 [Pipistrellus kuhlii]KAF6392374.1 leucine carboxyl methyltransferase 2 [Pipistrellus kuhlii]